MRTIAAEPCKGGCVTDGLRQLILGHTRAGCVPSKAYASWMVPRSLNVVLRVAARPELQGEVWEYRAPRWREVHITALDQGAHENRCTRLRDL